MDHVLHIGATRLGLRVMQNAAGRDEKHFTRAAQACHVTQSTLSGRINVCTNVHLMGLAGIIPEYFLEVIGPVSDVRAVPLTNPLVEYSVGLVAVDRDPVSPLVLAAFECARITEPPPISRRHVGR
jgi:hypothetical protein